MLLCLSNLKNISNKSRQNESISVLLFTNKIKTQLNKRHLISYADSSSVTEHDNNNNNVEASTITENLNADSADKIKNNPKKSDQTKKFSSENENEPKKYLFYDPTQAMTSGGIFTTHTPGVPTRIRCYNCGAIGHISYNCTVEIRKKTCFNCGNPGHLSRDW